jgi:glutamate-1-semialdehyde 2,1-aminomutase
VRPDLWCFGKVIGGGLPLAAFGGRRDVMSALAPLGPVYQAGTLSGNPLATAAGLTVLSLLDEEAYERLSAIAGRLQAGLETAFAEAGLAVAVPRFGPLLGLVWRDEAVVDFAGARRSADRGWYPPLFHGLLSRGVSVAPGAYEILFPSLAHGPEEIERTVAAAGEAALEVVKSLA